MAYIEWVLESGERVRCRGDFHWSVYVIAGLLLGTSLLLAGMFIVGWGGGWPLITLTIAVVLFLYGLAIAINCMTTEIAVTNRRVMMKTGVIARRTTEMNLSKIESVDLDQSVLGGCWDTELSRCGVRAPVSPPLNSSINHSTFEGQFLLPSASAW